MTDNVIYIDRLGKAHAQETGDGKKEAEGKKERKTPERKKPPLGDAAALLREADPEPPAAPRRRRASSGQGIDGDGNTQIAEAKTARQSIRGRNNVQISGTGNKVVIAPGPVKETIRVDPPSGTIGDNATLKKRIQALAKEILDSRLKRLGSTFEFGKFWYGMARNFEHLGVEKWADIWMLKEGHAPEVIEYLEEARDNTIDGRIKKAAKRKGYQHKRGHLFALEKQYAEHLGWNEEDIRKEMRLVTGKDSHKELGLGEHQTFVDHLERLVDKLYGEADG